ncbi:MAG: alpha/beta hydrolase family protein [Janthinobacterium lividum]|nr:dienelactone hydrolase [Pseudomonas sp. MWU16-30317]
MRVCAYVIVVALLSLVSVQAEAVPAPRMNWSVGYHRLTFTDPVDQQPMHAFAFYPSTAPARPSKLDGFQVDASEDTTFAIGRFPLLVLSHGNTGTPLALHDLITSMVRKGFVVVAVVHPGDNNLDHSRLGALSNLYGRPMQISEAITEALQDPMLSPYINPQEVGVIGYSAGGETALILTGARPELDRLRRYCVEKPDDADACKTRGELVVDRDDLAPHADPRVHALLLMAPLSLMFGRQTLASVTVPTLIYAGDNDKLVAFDKNAGALARKLTNNPDYRLLPGAGHFVFMAPCSDEQKASAPGLCNDADGVDRVGIHHDLIDQAGHFFAEALSKPSRAGLQTADQ